MGKLPKELYDQIAAKLLDKSGVAEALVVYAREIC